MFDLRGTAVVGALGPLPDVQDHGAVAVCEVGPALPTANIHDSFLAPLTDKPGLPRGIC